MPIPRKSPSLAPVIPEQPTEAELNRRRRDYIVYPIIPRNEITLISGSPRTGVTTLLTQIQDDFHNGKPVLSFAPFTAPSCFVVADHTRGTVQRICRRIGAEIDELNVMVTGLRNKMPTFPDLCKKIKKDYPDTEVVFLDGYHRLIPGNRKDYDVGTQGTDLVQRTLEDFELTLVAAGRGSKLTADNIESSPLERFYGSIGTTERIATFISLERTDISHRDRHRTICVLTQDCPIWQDWEFTTTGMLVPRAEAVEENSMPSDSFGTAESVVFTWPTGSEFTAAELYDVIREVVDVTDRSCKRYISQWLNEGKLRKVGHGRYLIPRGQ